MDGKDKEEQKQTAWKNKPLLGQFVRKTEGMQGQRKRQLLKADELKWETESFICSAQEQALKISVVKNDTDH